MSYFAIQSERRSRLKDEIVRRVTGGESLSAVCRDPAMPHFGSVWRWARRDAAFRAQLDEARRRGRWRREKAFDDARAEAFLARLRAGETLRSLLRDRTMPGQAMLRWWRLTQPDFGAEVLRVIAVRRRVLNQSLPPRGPTAWSPELADRVLLMVGRGHACSQLRRLDRTLPSYRVLRAWRRARPEFDQEFRVTLRMGRVARDRARRAAVLPRVLDGIVMGGSLRSLGRQGGLPGSDTLYRWVADDPAIARAVAEACDARDEAGLERVSQMLEAAGSAPVKELRQLTAPLTRRLGQLSKRPGRRWLD